MALKDEDDIINHDDNPRSWDVRTLGSEIVQLEAGVSVNSVNDGHPVGPHDRCILKTSAVANGRFFEYEVKKIAPKDIDRARLNPRANTIIVSRMNTPDLVGECGFVEREYPNLFLPDRLWMSQIRAKSDLDVRWLSYLLSSDTYKKKLKAAATGTSGSMKNLSKSAFLSLEIPFPPADEQISISTALHDADRLIEALEKLVTKKAFINAGATQQLMAGKMRLRGFSNKWSDVLSGEVGYFRGGSGFPLWAQGKKGGDRPFFKVSDMNNNGNELFMVVANHRVSDERRKTIGAALFPSNSIVFAKVGAAIFLERKLILSEPSCIDNNMAAFVIDERKADTRFMHKLLLRIKLSALCATTALPALNAKQLGEIQLRIPDIAEQRSIADFLASMDAEMETLEKQLRKMRAVKHGMMQQLLTGKTRLISQGEARA